MNYSDYIDKDGNIKITDDMSEELKASINILNQKNAALLQELDEDDDDDDIDVDEAEDEGNSYIEDIEDSELDESQIADLNNLF